MQQKETLSAYMDGQKVDADFVETLANNAELKQKWANYHAIRSVMQGEEMILGNDFSAKMEALLENEEIEAQPRGLVVKLKRWAVPLMQAGIAASVCLVAVLGVNMMNSNEEVASSTPALQTLPFSNSVQAVSYNAPEKDLATEQKLATQQQKIDELLKNSQSKAEKESSTNEKQNQ